jgi:putative addiction module CopG family antidote
MAQTEFTSMNVSLPKELREWIQNQVASRGYASVSEFMRDLVRQAQRAQEPGLDILDMPGQPWRPVPEERLKRLRGE